MSLVKQELKSSASTVNLKLREIVELCFQPETEDELKKILLNFRKKLEDSRESEYFCRFDNICMYALDYVYKHDTVSFSTVSRSLFLYQMQYHLVLSGTDRNLIFSCGNNCFLKELQQFKDLHSYSKSEKMLVDVGLGSILAGNLGLALFLVKFGLIEFPSEINEKCRKMFKILVEFFNNCSRPLTVNVRPENMQIPIRHDELLNQVKEKEIKIRRSMFIFCILVIVSEYHEYEKIEDYLGSLKFYTEHKKNLCLQKLKCVDLYIRATTETIITFRDIENFIEVILNLFITADVGKSLLETCRKILGHSHSYSNPRSLKDLVRVKIRSTLSNLMSIPEQVNELNIPAALKKFLNFHSEGTWELLLINHLNLSFELKLNRHIPELEDENAGATENGDVQEDSENERETDDGKTSGN